MRRLLWLEQNQNRMPPSVSFFSLKINLLHHLASVSPPLPQVPSLPPVPQLALALALHRLTPPSALSPETRSPLPHAQTFPLNVLLVLINRVCATRLDRLGQLDCRTCLRNDHVDCISGIASVIIHCMTELMGNCHLQSTILWIDPL